MKHYLFSYGDLQLKENQKKNYGRVLSGEKDSLGKYKLNRASEQTIALKTNSPNDQVEGIVFELTEEELKITDAIVSNDYKRVEERFSSGKKGWVYVAKKKAPKATIPENIQTIRKRMSRACKNSGRAVDELKLLLATKTVEPERIKKAFDCGEMLIAENKVQEVRKKAEALSNFGIPYEQHFIGHLQTNKVNKLLRYDINCIQSLDRWSLAEKLHNRLRVLNRKMDVFIQVNTSAEESKFGVDPGKTLEFVKQVATLDTLKIKGLMTIGLFSSDEEKVRACFKRLKAVQEEIVKADISGVEMDELSMGMSGDLEIAIEEGATLIRVGTAVFGERKYPDSYYWNENGKSD